MGDDDCTKFKKLRDDLSVAMLCLWNSNNPPAIKDVSVSFAMNRGSATCVCFLNPEQITQFIAL